MKRLKIVIKEGPGLSCPGMRMSDDALKKTIEDICIKAGQNVGTGKFRNDKN